MDLVLLEKRLKMKEGEAGGYPALKPYPDTTGNMTIGWGRNLTGNGISVAEAEFLLENDITTAATIAKAQDWWNCLGGNDARENAMIEIVFNLGLPRLNGFVKALAALRQQDFETAAEEFGHSLWEEQVGARAVEICAMIQTGTFGDD